MVNSNSLIVKRKLKIEDFQFPHFHEG